MRVVVTSGGVKEKIDNVRSITNSSSGKLGNKIARCFLKTFKEKEDFELIYIYAGLAEPIEDDNVINLVVKDTNDLLQKVEKVLKEKKIDIFVHCMAVADYTTNRVIDFGKFVELSSIYHNVLVEDLLKDCEISQEGKISSEIEKPAILLQKTPKVIKRIKELSPYTFLVGFKLLDTVFEEELFDVGFDLLRRNRCNLVLANDIKLIRQGTHRGLLIYPEKTYDVIEGKDNIAMAIVNESIKRVGVKHPKSVQVSNDNKIKDSLYNEFNEMGKYLDNLGVLPKVLNHDRPDKIGTYGNMSARVEEGFYITCRNVNKSDLKKGDLSYIEKVKYVSDKGVYSNVYYNSEIKPSIDTTIHSKIYSKSSYMNIVHIHTDMVFLGIPLVEDRFPCGCSNECDAIVDMICRDIEDKKQGIVQMRKHGLIVTGNSFQECKEKIRVLFEETPYIDYSTHNISNECVEHIEDVGASFIKEKLMYPLKINGDDVGGLFEKYIEGKGYVDFGLFLIPEIRRRKLHVLEKYLHLYSRNYILHTTEDCHIVDLYKKKYGFVDFDTDDDTDLKYILRKEKEG